MARYMRNDLQSDLVDINKTASQRGSNTYLVAQGRNGYTGLDEYDIITRRCIRNVESGTPKECLTAALNWAL